MLSYKNFDFATAPATDWSWKQVTEWAGIKPVSGEWPCSLPPPDRPVGRLLVGMVRHPVAWLQSLLDVSSRPFEFVGTQIEDIWELLERADGFESFVGLVVDKPGIIMALHRAYAADNVMRCEDMPWAAIEFFGTMGIAIPTTRPITGGPGKEPALPAALRQSLMESERELCEMYDYY